MGWTVFQLRGWEDGARLDDEVQELAAVIRRCAGEVGGVPSVARYLRWRRDRVHGWSGASAPTPLAFERVFGSWVLALAAAGFAPSAVGGGHVVRHGGRPMVHGIEEGTCRASVRLVAGLLGHTPSSTEYFRTRRSALQEAQNRELGLVSYATLARRYPSWRAVIDAAGLPPIEPPRRPDPRPGSILENELEEALRRAARALGGPPTMRGYDAWRKTNLEDWPWRSGRPPTPTTFRNRYGTWRAACRVVLGS